MTNTHPAVKFGDVVRNINENERNPFEKDLKRYIGLERPESITENIRRQ